VRGTDAAPTAAFRRDGGHERGEAHETGAAEALAEELGVKLPVVEHQGELNEAGHGHRRQVARAVPRPDGVDHAFPRRRLEDRPRLLSLLQIAARYEGEALAAAVVRLTMGNGKPPSARAGG
jgi:hypothetical protein